MENFCSTKEAALLLGIQESIIQAWCANGVFISYQKNNGMWMLSKKQFYEKMEYMLNHKRMPRVKKVQFQGPLVKKKNQQQFIVISGGKDKKILPLH